MLDESVLSGLNQLDQPSFDTLFKEVFPRLLLFTEKLTRNSAESEDIAISAFTTLWEGIKMKNLRFNSVPQVQAYIYNTARFKAIAFLRSQQVQQRYKHYQVVMSEKAEVQDLKYYTLWSLIVDEVYVEIEKLPEKCREVFKLCYFSDLSRAEVAGILNLSKNTVDAHCKYAIGKLKAVFSSRDIALFIILLSQFNSD